MSCVEVVRTLPMLRMLLIEAQGVYTIDIHPKITRKNTNHSPTVEVDGKNLLHGQNNRPHFLVNRDVP